MRLLHWSFGIKHCRSLQLTSWRPIKESNSWDELQVFKTKKNLKQIIKKKKTGVQNRKRKEIGIESGLKTSIAPETSEDLNEALAQQQAALAKHHRAQAVGVPVIAPDLTHNVYKDEIDVVKQRSDFQHQNNVLTVALEKKIKQKQEDAARQEEELIEQQRLAMAALADKKAAEEKKEKEPKNTAVERK